MKKNIILKLTRRGGLNLFSAPIKHRALTVRATEEVELRAGNETLIRIPKMEPVVPLSQPHYTKDKVDLGHVPRHAASVMGL